MREALGGAGTEQDDLGLVGEERAEGGLIERAETGHPPGKHRPFRHQQQCTLMANAVDLNKVGAVGCDGVERGDGVGVEFQAFGTGYPAGKIDGCRATISG